MAAGGGDTGSGGSGGGTPSPLPGLLEDLYNFFSDLFGGGGGQSLPPNYFVFQARLQRARRHPQYPDIDSIPKHVIVNQAPSAAANPSSNTPPLQKPDAAGQVSQVQEIIPYEGGGELTVPGEPQLPFSLTPRPITYSRCLDAAEHPVLWANLCREMPNPRLATRCWEELDESVERRRGFCQDVFSAGPMV